MAQNIIFLGGSDEIGANSIYLYLDGTGLILDAGMHPKKRDNKIFPNYEIIQDKPVDTLIISHAHTDHLGALPYLLKKHPHVKIIATEASKDISEIMLKDTAKILKSEVSNQFTDEALSLFKPEILEKINILISGVRYNQKINLTGRGGQNEVNAKLIYSGHILGSAGVLIEHQGRRILYTSDFKLNHQSVHPGAEFPYDHIDILIIEATNAATPNLPDLISEKNRLANFINAVVNENGSVLMPVFALGKHQEILTIVYNLMKSGKIPYLPIYTAGLSRKISRLYDVYTYSAPRIKPGAEMTDIPQQNIVYDELLKGKYFSEPSIVIVPSGMMNEKTLSFNLARRWLRLPNFGIAFTGYLDEDSPGFSLANSVVNEEFMFGLKTYIRKCKIGKFRFSAHASLVELVQLCQATSPRKIFINHGSEEARFALYKELKQVLPGTELVIPYDYYQYEL